MKMLKLICMMLAVGLYFSCSGQQQDDEQLDVDQQDQQDQQYQDDQDFEDNVQDEGQYDQQGENEFSNEDDMQDSADINNAMEDDTQEVMDEGGDDFNATLNNSGGQEYAQQAPMQEMPMQEAPMESAPVASGGTAPVAGGQVRYVPVGGVQVYSAPNGSAVTTLEQGEHPVTWEDSGWLRISDGWYVPADSLSNAGVGRDGMQSNWGGY